MPLGNYHKTELLREFLHDEGVSNPKSYEWYEGEALYLGNPFTPTSYEEKAINKVLNWEKGDSKDGEGLTLATGSSSL